MTKKVLHVGCGPQHGEALHPMFRDTREWEEVRLDVNAEVAPDIIGDIRSMPNVESGSMDAVWCCHNIEHIYAHEVPLAFAEFLRVLKEKGLLVMQLPDLQRTAEHIAADKLEEPLYLSPGGPISPLVIVYGHTGSIAAGNHFMAHKTGFTARSMGMKLLEAGFCNVNVIRDGFDLHVVAQKDSAAAPAARESFNVQDRGPYIPPKVA